MNGACRRENVQERRPFAAVTRSLFVTYVADSLQRLISPLNSQLVTNASDDEVDKIRDGFWGMVKAGHGWKNHGSGLGQSFHIVQSNRTERRLPRDDDQFAPLFQMNVSCPMNQVLRLPRRDARQRSHRTRADHHSGRQERATGNPRRIIAIVMIKNLSREDFTVAENRACIARSTIGLSNLSLLSWTT